MFVANALSPCVRACVSRQLVCQCCEGEGHHDSRCVLEKLISRVREGQLGQATFLRLLRDVQQTVPSSFPTELSSLLEEVREEPAPAGAEEPPSHVSERH